MGMRNDFARSPAVWRQEIRELTLLPIRTQSNNALRLLINPHHFPHKTSPVTSLSAKLSTPFSAQELETGNEGHTSKGRREGKLRKRWRSRTQKISTY